ncbi:MAG TPA: hypothetical protein VFY27_06750 [Woeseiaceae bacterium]|nr:hypothetical protein [Woeseiaceae bacterium]
MRLTIEFGFTPTRRLRRPLLPFAVLAATTASAMTWLEVDKLLPSDGHEHAFFGHTVAIDDNTAIVATPFDAGAGEVGDFRGAAYVFARDNLGNWDAQAKLLPAFSGFAHQFGYSVDIDGSTVIAGMFEEDLNPTEDAAYIFVRDASGNWREEAALTASDGIFGDGFSVSVAVDGDTAFVGTRPETLTGFVDLTGAVYVFNRDASGTWSEQAKLVASDSAIGDTFGRTLDLDGDTAIISRARDDDDGTGTVIVSAYIFTRDALGTWSEHTKLSTSRADSLRGRIRASTSGCY